MADDPTRREAREERFRERIEIPMLVLSILLVPVLLMPLTEDLSPWSIRVPVGGDGQRVGYFVSTDTEDETDEIGDRLDRIEAQLARLVDATAEG